MKRFLTSVISIVVLAAVEAFAGTVTGQVQNAQQGPLVNGTFTFQLTQPATVAGTALVAPTPVSCFTDANGNVVGEPNPLALPSVTSNLASGTLAAGQYFIRLTYQDGTGETVASPEVSFTMSGQGTLIVNAPGVQPANATAFRVYISTTTGTETLQGSVTVSPGSWGNYSQSSPLVAGSALPGSNTTACKLRFNDELSPSFACYDTTLAMQGGMTIPGFPQFWYFSGGGAGSINLGNGFPQSNVCQGVGFFWPQAIVATPALNGQQSIAGPLNTCASNGVLQVGSGCYPSLTSCYAALAPGQTCQVPPNWTDPIWTANLVMNKNNAGLLFMGAATMAMGTNQLLVSTGTIGAFIKAVPAATNRSSGAGTAVTFNYTGTSDAFAVGSAGTGTPYIDFQNFNINASSGANAVALHIIQSNNGSYTNIGGGGTGNGAVGLLLDGNGACTCDNNFYNTGFGAGASGSAIRLKNSANLNHFYGGSVTATAASSIGIDLQGINGNTFDMDDEGNVTAVSATGTNTTKNIIRVYLGGNTTDYSFNASSSNNVLENLSGTTLTPNGTDLGTNNRITIGPQPGVINHQGQTGTLTGNSSDQVVYTFTLPAGVVTAGKCLRVKYHWFHSLQTNTVNYLIKFGSTSVFGGANGLQSGGADNTSLEYFWADICNNSGVQNAQDINIERCLRTAAVANIPGCNSAAPGHTTTAIDFTAQQIITATFNVANTDQIIGTGFWVELL